MSVRTGLVLVPYEEPIALNLVDVLDL